MDYAAVIQADLDKGFTKSALEILIGLPKNNLASFLTGKRELSKISKLKIEKWDASEKPDPLNIVIPKSSIDKNRQESSKLSASSDYTKSQEPNEEINNKIELLKIELGKITGTSSVAGDMRLNLKKRIRNLERELK